MRAGVAPAGPILARARPRRIPSPAWREREGPALAREGEGVRAEARPLHRRAGGFTLPPALSRRREREKALPGPAPDAARTTRHGGAR